MYLCILVEVFKTYVYILLYLLSVLRANFLIIRWQCYLHARILGRNSVLCTNALSVTLEVYFCKRNSSLRPHTHLIRFIPDAKTNIQHTFLPLI
jgi:hypothetical protein